MARQPNTNIATIKRPDTERFSSNSLDIGDVRLQNRYNNASQPKKGTNSKIINVGSLLESRNRLAISIIFGKHNRMDNTNNTPPPIETA